MSPDVPANNPKPEENPKPAEDPANPANPAGGGDAPKDDKAGIIGAIMKGPADALKTAVAGIKDQKLLVVVVTVLATIFVLAILALFVKDKFVLGGGVLGVLALFALVVWQMTREKPPKVAENTVHSVKEFLQPVATTSAKILRMDPALVRSNIFMPSKGGKLRIPHDWHYNMAAVGERGLALRPGKGACGAAFKEKKPILARSNGNWGKYALDEAERSKIDDQLKWVVSIPIPDPAENGRVFGVLNVDGLKIDQTFDDLGLLVDQVLFFAAKIGEQIPK